MGDLGICNWQGGIPTAHRSSRQMTRVAQGDSLFDISLRGIGGDGWTAVFTPLGWYWWEY